MFIDMYNVYHNMLGFQIIFLHDVFYEDDEVLTLSFLYCLFITKYHDLLLLL